MSALYSTIKPSIHIGDVDLHISASISIIHSFLQSKVLRNHCSSCFVHFTLYNAEAIFWKELQVPLNTDDVSDTGEMVPARLRKKRLSDQCIPTTCIKLAAN
ncbi:hypothetical protein Bca101_015666 [Brassica carinata]